MDNQALQQIKEIVDRNDHVSVIVGRNPKIDDMAAALALYLTLQASGKKVAVASVTEPLVEHSSLVGIDKVTTQLQANTGGDLTVSFPYKEEGEIEKVSYTIENGFLNIIVKAGEQGLSFTEQDVRYSSGGGGGTAGLLFTVGISRLSDVQTLYNAVNDRNTTVINIDNKDQNENYGNVVLVSPKFSSVSEQVADLLLSLGYDFDPDTAQNLLIGISSATDNFQSQSTSYLAFEIAAILLRKGARRITTNNQGQAPVQRVQPRQPQRQTPVQRSSVQPAQTNDAWLDQLQRSVDSRQQSENMVRQQPSQQVRPAQTQTRTAPVQQPITNQTDDNMNPPADWLTPKVYKGSTNV